MRIPTFIRIENTFSEAMSYRNSPETAIYTPANGIHLVPSNPYPYIQRTYAKDGIELDGAVVHLMDMCGNVLVNVSSQFQTTEAFNDPVTGLPQVKWKYRPNYDAGWQLVYLRFNTGSESYLYSSPFMQTNDEAEYTSQWWYGSDIQSLYSIGISLFYKQDDDEQEVTNYTTVSGNRTFNATTTITAFEIWHSRIVDIKLFRLFKQIFLSRHRYSLAVNDGGLPVLTGLKEAFETPRIQGREMFGEAEILLLRDTDIEFDPLAPPPPTPPLPVPAIILESVLSINKAQVEYTFTLENFSPSYLTFQWSLDQINWNQSTNGVISPMTVTVMDNHINEFYYRIVSGDLESNIVQQPPKTLTITNITSEETEFIGIGNHYKIYFTKNFTLVVSLAVEGSVDGGDNWLPLYYNSDNNSPKDAQTPSSGLEFTLFRLKYVDITNDVLIYSNEYSFSFTPTT